MSIDLVRFPPEIFASICEFAGTMSTIRFWLSGDVKVIQLMSVRGGIRAMHLQDMKMGSTSRWPAMLAECRHLNELTVKCSRINLSIPLDALMSMKNLRVLHLDCEAANVVSASNLLSSFPKLEDLSLEILMSPLSTSSLPQTLTRLSLQFFGSRPDPLSVVEGYTMPNLTKLKIWDIDGLTITAPLAFALDELSVTSNLQAPNWKIPNTLTKLIHQESDFPRDFDHWQYTHLVELQVHKLDVRSLSTLPMRNLIHLKKFIWESWDPLCISTNMQPMFPASLQHLRLLLPIKFENALVLPHALQHLEFVEMGDYKIVTELNPSEVTSKLTPLPHDETSFLEYIKNLTVLGIPKTLKFLFMKFPTFRYQGITISPSAWQHNGTSVYLQTLVLDGVEVDQNPFDLLPDTLTKLELYDTYPIRNDQLLRFTELRVLVIKAPVRRVNFNYFHNLPASLRSLSLHLRGNFDESILKHLSRGLESLDIAIKSDGRLAPILSKDSFLLLQQFTKLTYLRLEIPIHGVQDWMLGALPRNLNGLILDFETGTACTSGCFIYLPSKLTNLRFNRLKSIDMAHYADLPRGLRQLLIQFEGDAVMTKQEELSGQLASGMPPTLSLCVIDHKRYTSIDGVYPSSVNEERRLPSFNQSELLK